MPRHALTAVPSDHHIKATFEIVTPMFLGDADQKATAIRPTSIKGALRFWWRALNGHLSLTDLAEKEAKLFGSTDRGGVFRLAIESEKIKKNEPNPAGEKDPAISIQKFGALHYSLGQGLNATRNALLEGQFVLSILFRATVSDSDKTEIEQALQAFGLLGALGSRARHGWGAVSLIQIEGAQSVQVAKSIDDYQSLLQKLMTGRVNQLPAFTAFSNRSRIDIVGSGKEAQKLLAFSAGELQMYRSFGNNGKVGSKDAERNFTNDHDLVLEHIQGRQADLAPKRVVFGLPHNYFFSNGKGKADVNAKVGNEETRRASPLFTHIQKVGDQFVLVHAFLPAEFLPPTARITIKGGRTPTAQISPNVDWRVITDFMDRKAFANARKVVAQ